MKSMPQHLSGFLSSVFLKSLLSVIKRSVNSHHYMLARKRDVKCCSVIHIVMKKTWSAD